MTRIFRSVLLLLITVSLFLTSCATVPIVMPEESTPSREELHENVEKNEETYPTVVAYLRAWNFPPFFEQNISFFEDLFSPRIYPTNEQAKTVAEALADEILGPKYESVDLSSQAAVTTALQEAFLTVLFRMQPDTVAASEIDGAANEENQPEFEYVTQYLASWGFPVYRLTKLILVESVFHRNYYRPLPDTLTLARTTEKYFTENLYESADFTDMEALTDAVIRAFVLSVGDKYAVYRTAAEYGNFETDMSGAYVGIGVTVQYTYADGKVEVTALNESGGAFEAGVQLGDLLWAVEGQLVSEIGYQTAVSRIRGEEGTTVNVSFKRGEEILDFAIVRRALTEETVTYRIDDDGIAYVKITEFKENTGLQFRKTVNELEAAGVRGVIYDVRANPGGYVSSVVTALSYLVPLGTPIISFGEWGPGYTAYDDHTFDVPSVVICNGNTASAGELFTAALRDYTVMGLADSTVIGTLTYKKGIMQSAFSIGDGSMLTFTVALYYPPSGVNYDGVGITPDEIVEKDPETDNQLARAYEILQEKLIK